MTFSRRGLVSRLSRTIFALAAFGALGVASAQTGKPVKLMVGFPPGGGTDAIARTLAADGSGRRLHVDWSARRPGDFVFAAELDVALVEHGDLNHELALRRRHPRQRQRQALKAAPADGTTYFLSHDHTITILPMVTKNPGFAPATDFMPVAGFATFVNAFAVSGGTPAKSFNEYVNWVRTQGNGKGSVGVPAPASTPEFLVKLIGEKYKLDLVAAPYRGSAPMMADMLGNQIAAGVASVPDFIENHKAGKVRVVGVLGDKRQAAMPDVPTFAELGLAGFEDMPYYGIFAPAGTPKATVDQFSAAVAKAT